MAAAGAGGADGHRDRRACHFDRSAGGVEYRHQCDGRLLRQGKAAEAARYRDRLDEVSVEVHQHLKEVADLLGDLVPARRGRPGVGAFRGSAPGR
jgi:hypothetical protein